MPYFEVSVNGKKISVGGGPDVDLLLVTLIAQKTGLPPQLSLTGMRKLGTGESEFIEWIRQEVGGNDRIRIAALKNAVPEPPIAKTTARKKPLGEIFGSDEGEAELEQPTDLTTRTARLAFDITTAELRHLTANIGDEDTLQMVLTWHGGSGNCKFEVDSITVLEDGHTKGRHWADGDLKSGHWIEIETRVRNQSGTD
jgi:hypothetical protein